LKKKNFDKRHKGHPDNPDEDGGPEFYLVNPEEEYIDDQGNPFFDYEEPPPDPSYDDKPVEQTDKRKFLKFRPLLRRWEVAHFIKGGQFAKKLPKFESTISKMTNVKVLNNRFSLLV
jgi:hypothetical protein